MMTSTLISGYIPCFKVALKMLHVLDVLSNDSMALLLPVNTNSFMPLFHQRIKPRSCQRPLIVGSLGKNGKKIDQWGGRQNRYEGLGLTTDRPQDAPGGPRQSLTGLGLRTD